MSRSPSSALLWTALFLLAACSATSEGDGSGGGEGPPGEAPVIERFELEPGEGLGVGGGQVTFTWSVTGADSLSISPGVGEVEGSQATATVSRSTAFTLTASNEHGSAEASAAALVASSGPPLFDPSEPNAAGQIDRALALGEIDEVTALRYKVFALFGDNRLPPELAADGPVHGTPIMRELARGFDALPPDVQDEMRPFRLPPDDPSSWYASRSTDKERSPKQAAWHPLSVLDGKVEILWDPDFGPMDEGYVRSTVVPAVRRSYVALTELMDRDPISDARGGGPYRVWVVEDPNMRALGHVAPTSPSSVGWESHLVINMLTIFAAQEGLMELASLAAADFLAGTIAHEMLHAIQVAFDVDATSGPWLSEPENWLSESTATWAEDYVYERLNTEHLNATHFYQAPHASMDDPRGGLHAYGSYVFHLFLVAQSGDKFLVRRFYEESETKPIFEAVNDVLEGKLVDLWSDFVVENWNDPNGNLSFGYQAGDDLDDGVSRWPDASTVVDVTLSGELAKLAGFELNPEDGQVIGPPIIGARALSAQYFHLKFPDEEARSLLFANGFNYELLRGAPSDLPIEYEGDEFYVRLEAFQDIRARNTRTQALVKNQGVWSGPYDLTTVPFVAFCQDLPEERVEELVLIFSNASFKSDDRTPKNPRGGPPTLLATNMACGRWEGSAEGLLTATATPGTPDFTLLEVNEIKLSNLVFARDPEPIEKLMRGSQTTMIGGYSFSAFLFPSYTFSLVEGGAEWTVTYASSSGTQTCEGGGSLLLDGEHLWGLLQTYNHYLSGDPDLRRYRLEMLPQDDLVYDVSCTIGPGGQRSEGFNLNNTREGPFPIANDGVSIEGGLDSTDTSGIADHHELWFWDLVASDAP